MTRENAIDWIWHERERLRRADGDGSWGLPIPDADGGLDAALAALGIVATQDERWDEALAALADADAIEARKS